MVKVLSGCGRGAAKAFGVTAAALEPTLLLVELVKAYNYLPLPPYVLGRMQLVPGTSRDGTRIPYDLDTSGAHGQATPECGWSRDLVLDHDSCR